MHDPKVLANVYRRNLWVVAKQTEGLAHTDSLLQPEARGNCLNYVLGHMLASQDTVAKMLDLAPLMTPEESARYDSDSAPITGDENGVIEFERLLVMVRESASRLVESIEQLSADDLERDVKLGERVASLGQRLEFFGWHDSYHVGQTEYLRQLAGTDDKVI